MLKTSMETPSHSQWKVYMFKMHTFKIFQKLNHRNMFVLKKYNIPLELASVWQFLHTNTYKILKFISFQGNVKGHVFQKQAWRNLKFYVLFLFFFLIIRWFRMQEIRKILNQNFNYTHTSLIIARSTSDKWELE